MSKKGVLGTGQARKGGGVLGTGQVKKRGGGGSLLRHIHVLDIYIYASAPGKYILQYSLFEQTPIRPI